MSHLGEVRPAQAGPDRLRWTDGIIFVTAWSAIIAACAMTWACAIKLFF